jgi:adenine-specific DNA-methyltransferase
VIKYLGAKRPLVPVLGALASATGARTAVDLFTGTTRVAQELTRRGLHVTAVDVAAYSGVLGECYVTTDADAVDVDDLAAALAHLAALPGRRGYFTETFCERSRYLQPRNGMRVDAIRDAIDADFAGSPLRPLLLTSQLLAADRVDSTTGLQMAYLDPPYNQHRYFTNYHVWETLVRWDAPEHYGVACKRVDARDEATKSVFNRKREMPAALRDLLLRVEAEVVVVSCNDESWVSPAQVADWLREAGHEDVALLAFDYKRYVGAQIGIFNGSGEKVGRVGRLRNQELLLVAGPAVRVAAATGRQTAQR